MHIFAPLFFVDCCGAALLLLSLPAAPFVSLVRPSLHANASLLKQHGLPLQNAGDGNVLKYNFVIEDY